MWKYPDHLQRTGTGSAIGNVDLKLKEGSINLLDVFKKLNKIDHASIDNSNVRVALLEIIPDPDTKAVADSHLIKP